jgi:hypothetical protein
VTMNYLIRDEYLPGNAERRETLKAPGQKSGEKATSSRSGRRWPAGVAENERYRREMRPACGRAMGRARDRLAAASLHFRLCGFNGVFSRARTAGRG